MRLLPLLMLSSALVSPAFAQFKPPSGKLDPTTTINGTPASTVVTNAAAAVTALQPATLPSTAVRANFDDVARTLADRMSDHLNVKAFGAKGDGVTDDTLAFQNAAAVATGHIPTSIGVGLSVYLSALGSYFSGIGPKSNGAVEIDVPAGHYMLSAPIAVNYQPNNVIRWHGDGSSVTQLQFNGGTDGIVSTFNPNGPANANAVERTGLWVGQGIMIDGMQFIANTKKIPLVYSSSGVLGTNIGTGQGEIGAAIKTISIPTVGASFPPYQVYDDLQFTNSGGWNDAANNWKNAIYLQDPDNVFVSRTTFADHSLDQNVTSIPFQFVSTAVAATNVSGHGYYNFDKVQVTGALTGFEFDGSSIQGIYFSRSGTQDVQRSVVWQPPANSFSGSITLADNQWGFDQAGVALVNVSTIFSHDNFFYNVSPPAGHNLVAFEALNTTQVESHGDQFAGPAVGAMGSSTTGGVTTNYTSTAVHVSGYGAALAAPSHISDDTIGGFDVGIKNDGGSTINFTNMAVSFATGTCYEDVGAFASAGLRGQFDGIHCGAAVNVHDGIGYSTITDWATGRLINGGTGLGLPGITSPAGVKGYAGLLDFHSAPNTHGTSAGTLAGLNNYDVRLAASGGTDGTNGAGELDLFAAMFKVNTPTNLAFGALQVGGTNRGMVDLALAGSLTGSDARFDVSWPSGTALPPTARQGILTETAGSIALLTTSGAAVSGGLTTDSLAVTGSSTFKGNTTWSGGFPVLGSTQFKNLPIPCGASGLVYVSDGRKPNEAVGAGSGVLAVCSPTSPGATPAWLSTATYTAVAN